FPERAGLSIVSPRGWRHAALRRTGSSPTGPSRPAARAPEAGVPGGTRPGPSYAGAAFSTPWADGPGGAAPFPEPPFARPASGTATTRIARRGASTPRGAGPDAAYDERRPVIRSPAASRACSACTPG